jgi:hypothetical protein
VISQQYQSVSVGERKRTQQDAFDERKDRRRGSNANCQGENDSQGEAWRFAQLTKREADILRDRVHVYPYLDSISDGYPIAF